MNQREVIAKIEERQNAGMFKENEVRILYLSNIDMEIEGASEFVRVIHCSRCGREYKSRSYIDNHVLFGGHLELEKYNTHYLASIGQESYCVDCQTAFTQLVQKFVKPKIWKRLADYLRRPTKACA